MSHLWGLKWGVCVRIKISYYSVVVQVKINRKKHRLLQISSCNPVHVWIKVVQINKSERKIFPYQILYHFIVYLHILLPLKPLSLHIHLTFADISVLGTHCFNTARMHVLNQALCQYQSLDGGLAQEHLSALRGQLHSKSTIHDNTGLHRPRPLTAGLLCAVPLKRPCFPVFGQFNN